MKEIENPTRRRAPAPGPLTASRLDLAAKCPGSFALGHVQTESPAAGKGTEIHAFIETLLSEGLLEPQALTDPEARRVCERLDPKEVFRIAAARSLAGEDAEEEDHEEGKLLVENALALSPDAGEALALPEGGGYRDYSEAPEGYVCGTADVIAVFWDHVLITDWKSGGEVLPAPERNLQLRFHALAAALAYRVGRTTVQLAYIDGEGRITVSSFEFSEEDLAGIAAEIRGIVERIERARRGRPGFRVGSHCRYCPAFASCPAQAGAAQALLEEKLEELTPEKAAEAWRRLLAMEAATKKVRKALGDYAENRGGVPLEDGRELRLVESRRDTILPDVVMPLLRDLYGDEADRAVSITKKGIEKIAGDEARTVLSEIEGSGGFKTSSSESLREVGQKSSS